MISWQPAVLQLFFSQGVAQNGRAGAAGASAKDTKCARTANILRNGKEIQV